MGIIAATTNMPSSKFVSPKNGDTIPANTNFTIQMAIQHLETGHFTNANENYFAAPQVVNSAGDIQGHSHVVIDPLTSLDQTTPTDPTKFVFFKGLNDVAQNGVLSAVVDGGLPAGAYRLASINTAANHQPALVAIAQHGALDDMIYFTVSDNGAAAGASGAGAAGAASSAASASTAASSAAATAAAGRGSRGGVSAASARSAHRAVLAGLRAARIFRERERRLHIVSTTNHASVLTAPAKHSQIPIAADPSTSSPSTASSPCTTRSS
ncbi:hypothetical protein NUW54_g9619 [Trametes sanguinea]|uniref:Uncharacterized protein n=1 Tax=Trametes sanguinea TaxID=158606 RepID=A0ACC1P4L3_9APHY|nr:hypothetical protein NUW54_g9619 [Trametes sanguinea]